MTDRQLKELEKEDNWDYEHAQRRPGHKKGRAVVSVAFSRGDFEEVASQAERAGKPVSTFIRDVVLGHEVTHTQVAAFTSGLRGSIILSAGQETLTTLTQAPDAIREQPEVDETGMEAVAI